jgi:hypothetical protein
MANPIKYTNATQSNSIKTSNFAIGVNNGGYGPTNITNFYNGKTPNVGGYTVYVSNGVGSPSVFVAVVEIGLITLQYGTYDNEGNVITEPIYADGYHYDVMSDQEIEFESKIEVNNPKHTFAGY